MYFNSKRKGVPCSFTWAKEDVGLSLADGGKMHHHLVVSLFESQWNTLEMVLLKEILLSIVRAGDPFAAWSAIACLLRYYIITPLGKMGSQVPSAMPIERLPSGTHCADRALPFIRGLTSSDDGWCHNNADFCSCFGR